MKRLLLLATLPFLLTGCIKYGKGQTVGYVYAVDDGIVWDKVWYKSSPASGESDCYLISNDELKQQLRSLPAEQKVKLNYVRHLMTLASCGGNEKTRNSTDDEIISFELLK